MDFARYTPFFKTKVLCDARRLHAHLAHLGLDRLPAIGNQLVGMYGNCRSIEDAWLAYDRIQDKDPASWNIILTAFAQNGHLHKARQAFEGMPCKNTISWNAMLTAYCNSGLLLQAGDLFVVMPAKNVITWNVMLTASAKTGHRLQAGKVFESMPQRDVVSWNVIIKLYADAGDAKKAKIIFDGMPQRESVCWNNMVAAFARNGYLDEASRMLSLMPQHANVSWNAVITGYAESGRLREAEAMFRSLPHDDVIAWSILIAGYTHSGQGKNALQLFRQMNLAGVRGDMITLCTVLDACATSSGASEGKLVHSMIHEAGFRPDLLLYTTLVNMYSRCGDLEAARDLFDKMPSKDLVTWTAMISAYTNRGPENALELFHGMLMHGFEPGLVTFVSVLSACGHAGFLAKAIEVFQLIIGDLGMQPSLEHYRCILDLLARTGQVQGAEDLVCNMPFEPDSMCWNILLSAFKMYGDVHGAMRVSAKIMREDSSKVHFIFVAMGKRSEKSKRRRRSDSSSSSDEEVCTSSSSSSEDEERSRKHRRKHKHRHRHSDKERKIRKKDRHERKKHKHGKAKKAEDDAEMKEAEILEVPEAIATEILTKFPDLAGELKQLLQMLDSGEGVDVSGIPDENLKQLLGKLFRSLQLSQVDQAYLLPEGTLPTLETLSSILKDVPSVERPPEEEQSRVEETPVDIGPAPRPRVIGPAMPTPEMLAAAARLSEAEYALRSAEEELSQDPFVGPPPPAVVAEAASTNEAERFEEVARILDPELETAYQKLGVKYDVTAEIIKKRYWKLSLMVHPDKCSHPQAQEAFTTINKAFNDLQDPAKRAGLDNMIAAKQRKEAEEAELKTLREAAKWRRMRGEIALVGDDELLAEAPKGPPTRDEWMTELPPERKAGPPSMKSTFFSKSEKSGRGDTSAWTDTPTERAQKAKMQYLEAYKQASLPAAPENVVETQRSSQLASIVDKYNERKRPESLVDKHKRDASADKKKGKKDAAPEQQEWAGNHPWKPWDREKDLAAGRKSVKLDAAALGKGLTSRFSSGGSQRKFL